MYPLSVVLVINDNPYGLMFSFEMYLKECSIDNALIILDGFDKNTIKVNICIKIIELKRWIYYDQEEEKEMDFEVSRSWENELDRSILHVPQEIVIEHEVKIKVDQDEAQGLDSSWSTLKHTWSTTWDQVI